MKNIYKGKYFSSNGLGLIKNPRIKIMAKISNNLNLKNKKKILMCNYCIPNKQRFDAMVKNN